MGAETNRDLSDAALTGAVIPSFAAAAAPRFKQIAESLDVLGVSMEVIGIDHRAPSGATHGEPLAGARIEVWQADQDGFYDVRRELGTRWYSMEYDFVLAPQHAGGEA